MRFFRAGVIDCVLSDRLLKIRHLRESEKALHFDRDLPRAFLGSEDLLHPKVDIHVLLSPPDVERVVGDRPTIPDQGVLDLIVISITRGHHIDPWKLSADHLWFYPTSGQPLLQLVLHFGLERRTEPRTSRLVEGNRIMQFRLRSGMEKDGL